MAYKSNLVDVLRTFEGNIKKAMKQCGEKGVDNIRFETPVDTGILLENNDYKQLTFDSVTFFNDEEYAPFVEFGTYKMNANPFFRRGINNSLNAFTNIIVNNMKI